MKQWTLVLLLMVFADLSLSQIITSRISAENISTTGFSVKWNNNQVANSFIRYGFTPALELGTLQGGNTQSPSIAISGGFASQVYYAQAVAQVGNIIHQSDTLPFITASNSSGDIRVYFNQPVNIAYANSTDNQATRLTNSIDDTLIAYINRAQHSIDIMVYNLGSAAGISDISGAINQAFLNGRAIRVVYNEDTGNAGIAELHPDIPRLISPESNFPVYGIMHNKIFVFDAFSSNANRSIVWTGSTNLTTQQINTDPNNVIIVQDQSLAKAYTMEFEEMWGSNTLTPNTSISRFGPDKKDNTPHYFNIGGRRVECYFSPSDGVNSRIIQAITEAQFDVTVNTMLITRNDIITSLIQSHNNGKDVKVIVNHPNEGSMQVQYDNLNATLGYRLMNYSALPQSGTLHHKLMFADAFMGTNPYVLTGSHNWSTAAEVRNDENTLVIYDADIVNLYLQEFMGRLGAVASSDYYSDFSSVSVYPNPTENSINISHASNAEISVIQMLDATGALLLEIIPSQQLDTHTLHLSNFASGVYFIKIMSNGVVHMEKIVLR